MKKDAQRILVVVNSVRDTQYISTILGTEAKLGKSLRSQTSANSTPPYVALESPLWEIGSYQASEG